jgi:hypothetical protein
MNKRTDRFAAILTAIVITLVLGCVVGAGFGAYYAMKHLPIQNREPLTRFGE